MGDTDIQWIKEALERIEDVLKCNEKDCRDRHTIIDKELAALKIKATIYGAFAGAIPAVVGMIMVYLKLR